LVRQAKEFRDEHDILREKALQLDRLEVECGKYREKMIELDFLKNRTNVIFNLFAFLTVIKLETFQGAPR